MLEKVLTYIHNWFDLPCGHDVCAFEPVMDVCQYFRITGSIFNDGLHQAPATDLKDETFEGGIWALAIPPALVELAEEIEAWNEAHAEELDSPYSSESFGGYSYAKAGDVSGGGNEDPTEGWQRKFRARLIPYRKLC